MQKKLILGTVLACMCGPAIAESQPGFYVGLGGGQVSLEDTAAGVHVEAEGTGYIAFGGYRFNEYGSLEAGYAAGKPDDTVMGAYVEADASAFYASALWQVPISPRFEGYLRVGAIFWETENTATLGQSRLSQKVDGNDWILGIGTGFQVTHRVGLRVEYAGSEFDGTDMRLLSLAAVCRF